MPDDPTNFPPSENGGNGDGRDRQSGRFLPGHSGGPGRPPGTSAAVQARQKLQELITDGDVAAAITTLRECMSSSKAADQIRAAGELLTWKFGSPVNVDVLERLAAIEEQLQQERRFG